MSFAIRAGRRTIEITHPDKPLFDGPPSKRDLAGYFERVAPAMLPHLARRALTLERYPEGIDGPRFMQQHAERLAPWLRRVPVPSRKGIVEHVVASDPATLVYLANLECITFHRWLSRSDKLERPDMLVFDLDPSPPVRPAGIRRAARLIGALLRELGLEPWVMTTGSRGYHVTLPLRRRLDFDQAREFARAVAELAVAREGSVFTLAARRSEREGKILIDVMRNAYGQTAVAPYAVRARPKAPVATPLHWGELDEARTSATRWRLADVPARLASEGDPWSAIARHSQPLGAAIETLAGLQAEATDTTGRRR